MKWWYIVYSIHNNCTVTDREMKDREMKDTIGRCVLEHCDWGLTTALHSKLPPAEDVMEKALQFGGTQTHQTLRRLLSWTRKE